jgi:hypothetical protein
MARQPTFGASFLTVGHGALSFLFDDAFDYFAPAASRGTAFALLRVRTPEQTGHRDNAYF